jgi:hypothetical protein
MKKKLLLSSFAAVCLFAASCSKDDDNPVVEPKGSFIIVAKSTETSYLLQTDDLSAGALTIENNGLETDGGTEWQFINGKYLYRLVYNQGNPGIAASYELDANGQIKARSMTFESPRFTTVGNFGKYVLTASSVDTDTQDDAGNKAKGIVFSYIDVETQALKAKTIIAENMLGNGEYVTVSGLVEANGKFYTAVCPLGVSAYGAAKMSASSYSGTHYTDSVWVAIYDGVSFTNPRIIRDSRLSYATTRFRSQYWPNIVTDDRDNVYVFSSDYENDKNNKPSGVLRINAGTETFDPNFFVNIETASGGRHVCMPYHITGDYFLLRMYSEPNSTAFTATSPTAYKLAIFNAADKSFRWVTTGLPAEENIGSISKRPVVSDGLIYVPIVLSDGSQPAIYAIDPATATATKGVVVTCNSIDATGKLFQ